MISLAKIFGWCSALAMLANPCVQVLADILPDKLFLDYTLSRNGIDIGTTNRELERKPDGQYLHTAWTRATGLARLMIPTEWREHGEFAVLGKDVQPRRFSEIRIGDKRSYEHHVTFDWSQNQLRVGNHAPLPLPHDIQDQSNIIYVLMLNPLIQPSVRILPLTDGKDVEFYRFTYQGKELLQTLFGVRETIVIRRVSLKQFEHEQRCRAQPQPDADCKQPDDFTYWLLPEKNHVPVKLERRRKDETTTMILREARGF